MNIDLTPAIAFVIEQFGNLLELMEGHPFGTLCFLVLVGLLRPLVAAVTELISTWKRPPTKPKPPRTPRAPLTP
jgi:hypothetical protein